jgi:hypothetical protein
VKVASQALATFAVLPRFLVASRDLCLELEAADQSDLAQQLLEDLQHLSATLTLISDLSAGPGADWESLLAQLEDG